MIVREQDIIVSFKRWFSLLSGSVVMNFAMFGIVRLNNSSNKLCLQSLIEWMKSTTLSLSGSDNGIQSVSCDSPLILSLRLTLLLIPCNLSMRIARMSLVVKSYDLALHPGSGNVGHGVGIKKISTLECDCFLEKTETIFAFSNARTRIVSGFAVLVEQH